MTNEQIMTVVKPAVCAQLKSPASAMFPVDLIAIVGDDINGYRVSGFVDSQNSYGAMLRNDFTAIVNVENGFPVVRSCTVGVQAAANNAKTFAGNYIAILIMTAIGGAILYFITNLIVGL